jgi:flagellar hook-associated protein 1 FlgK
MGLTQALNTALLGLRVNQSSLSLVAANVANADTPGYTRKSVDPIAVSANGTDIGVRAGDVQRALDQYVQRQLRAENAGANYADTRAQLYGRLQEIYGRPGSDSALETVFNNFTNALQALSTSPDDPAARSSVINAAQLLTQQLNQMSNSIQSLRGDAELALSDAVAQVNHAMTQIAVINNRLAGASLQDAETSMLMDQRDSYIDQLSQLMDIHVVATDHNQVSVFTASGTQLVGNQAAQLSFNAYGTITAQSQWNADPALSTVGTITLVTPSGNSVDMIQSRTIRSGTIAAYVQMRDQDLAQAQNQLDAIAAAMASALSDQTTAGSAVTVGAQSGFDIDTADLSAGNTVTINYTDSGGAHTLTLVRVDDPAALPLSNGATLDPDDTVVGIDFSGGMASVITQINTALASTGMTASNPSGTTLRVLDDGAGNTVDVDALSKTTTVTSLTGGSAELPFFTDGLSFYTGAFGGIGAQSVGFAGRISVNAALLADPSALVLYASGTSAGDSARPDFIYQQLTSAAQTFDANTGIGTTAAPFAGSLTTFLRQVISRQGDAANTANSLKQGQDIVLSSLQQRFNDTSGVNVDQEMANLLTLQNSYAANARVMTTIQQMLDALMNM